MVLDLRTAYFGYLAARRAMKVQEETVRQNQELMKQAQGFYQVGLKAKIDVTKAEANLYQAEANLIQAKNNVELARVTLMNALGIKTWPYKDVEDVLEVTPSPGPWRSCWPRPRSGGRNSRKTAFSRNSTRRPLRWPGPAFSRPSLPPRPMAGRAWISRLPPCPVTGTWARP